MKYLTAIALSCVLLACGSSAPPPPPEPSLVEKKVSEVDHLWVRPGVDFKSYKALLLDDAKVTFRQEAYRFSKIPKNELQRRLDSSAAMLQKYFKKTFERRIQENGRYQVATQPATGVLKLVPALVDVYLVNPDHLKATTRVEVLSRTTGDMTLKMEVRDSRSNELLAVIEDYQDAARWDQVQKQDNVTLYREAQMIVSRWASLLSDGLLDDANK